MDDSRLKSVTDAILSYHPEPEDIADEEVRAAREAGAVRQAELFLAMLDAANADQQAPAEPVEAPEPAPSPKEES